MLTPEQKAAIRAEEVFREEIRNEIASAGRHQQRGRKLWHVLNSSFVIWFLASIVVGVISWKISDAALNRERRETVRRLKWEVYNNGVEFEDAVKRAWNRFEYEAAFWKLQNPKARLVDLKPFTSDRITFEMEYLGAPADRNAAATARWATVGVWKLIESKLGKLDWFATLDDRTKKDLDESISTIVQKEIITPFSL